MLGSKLMEMLKTMSSKDLNKFDLFLRSPFYNKSENIVLLFELIQKEYPAYKKEDYQSRALDKEVVFRKLFPEKKSKDSSLRALMSQLSKLIEDFFVIIELENDNKSKLRNELMLESLLKRRLNNIFHKKLESIRKKDKKQKVRGTDYYYYMFQFSNMSFQHKITTDNRTLNAGLQDLMNKLDLFYIASKLLYVAASMNRQHVVDKDYRINLLNEVLSFSKDSEIGQEPYVKLYYHLCLLLRDEAPQEQDNFQELKKLLHQHPEVLPVMERHQIYAALCNYCAKKIKSSEEVYYEHLFALYKEMLAENMHIMDNFHYYYLNITITAVRLQEFEWAKQFIENYKDRVHPDKQEGGYHYNFAFLHFGLKNFEEALIHLNQVIFEDSYYHITHKTLLICTYYELNESEPLKSAIEALRIYLMRNKSNISEYNHKAFQNFINFIKKLNRIKQGGKKPHDALLDEIEKVKLIVERKWLVEKIAELRK